MRFAVAPRVRCGRDVRIPWRHTAAQFALVPPRPPLYARGTLDKTLFVLYHNSVTGT